MAIPKRRFDDDDDDTAADTSTCGYTIYTPAPTEPDTAVTMQAVPADPRMYYYSSLAVVLLALLLNAVVVLRSTAGGAHCTPPSSNTITVASTDTVTSTTTKFVSSAPTTHTVTSISTRFVPSSPTTHTIYSTTTMFTETTTVITQTTVHTDSHWNKHRIAGVPWPGKTYRIFARDTNRAICRNGSGGLYMCNAGRARPKDSTWLCVEKGGYLGFMHPPSGGYMGHDNNERMRAEALAHRGWELVTVRQHPNGAHMMMMPFWAHALRTVGVDDNGVDVVLRRHSTTTWEFVMV